MPEYDPISYWKHTRPPFLSVSKVAYCKLRQLLIAVEPEKPDAPFELAIGEAQLAGRKWVNQKVIHPWINALESSGKPEAALLTEIMDRYSNWSMDILKSPNYKNELVFSSTE